MAAFTLTSHDLPKAEPVTPSKRYGALSRRFAEAYGWPQSWSLWQNVPMTPWGYPMSSAPFARGASGTPIDRLGGRDIPLYWNEVDLRGFRVLSKFLTDTNQFGKGFLNRLVDYHVRKGFGWQACRRGAKKTAYPTGETTDPVVRKGQEVLDHFRDAVQWPLVSREAFRRLQRDGEVFGRFGLYGGRPWFRFVAADQVGNPSGDTTTPQSFGIETDPEDICDVWAYHVWDVADYPAGGEWIDAGDMIHVKVNVDSDVKRGLPSFFPVQDNLDTVRRLLSNMLGSAQKMAAVAWREKFPTASASQVQQLIPVPAAIDNIGLGPGPYGAPGYPGWNGGVNGFQQGEVIRVEGTREYEEGPTAAGVSNFIEAEQAALRGAAVSFGFPESIATGKIDDINFAAALTTGAPFAVAIEGGQFEYGCRWERASALKVFELAFRAGQLTREEWRALDVEITEPAPMIAEPEKETNRRIAMVRQRILSPQTAQLQEQLDPQHEAANWKEWDAANPQPDMMGMDSGGENNGLESQIRQESKDAQGHQHKGKGPGGGQFTSNGGDSQSGDKGKQDKTKDKSKSKHKSDGSSDRERKGKPPKAEMSERALRAQKSATRVDASIQRYCEEHNEPKFAKAIGGLSFKDNEPVDVVLGDGGVISHGIELKTMVTNKANKITMKRSAMDRKAEWEKNNKATFHTVVIDDSGVYNAKGEGQHDESKRRYFYRRGFGSFRVGTMHEVKNIGELKKLINTPNDKLPPAAQRKES